MSSTDVRGAPPGPLGRRILASVVDGVGTSLCVLPISIASMETDGGNRPVVLSAIGLILLCVWSLGQWVTQGTQGWTVGRRLLGLRVVDVHSGRPIGMFRVLKRLLLVEVSVLACAVGQWVVYASVFWDSTGRLRGWHDRVAEAIVVDVWAAPVNARLDDLRGQPYAWPDAPMGMQPAPAQASCPGEPPVPEHTRWVGMITSGQPVAQPDLVLPPPLGAAQSAPNPRGTLNDTTQLPTVSGPLQVSPEPAGSTFPVTDIPVDAVPALDSFWSTPVSSSEPAFLTRATALFEDTAPRPGPSSWAVRLPDGTTLTLGGDPVLIGRNPVAPSGLRAVAVQDPGMSVSKTHLVAGADATGAWVMDRASTNGTLVTLPDGQRIVCMPDQRVRVSPGTLVLFGDLTMTIGLVEPQA